MWTTAIVLAVLVFWAVGAYNRLIRLRSAAIQAFAALDTHLLRGLALLQEYEAAAQTAVDSHAQAAVAAAGGQFAAALAVVRARPLDAGAAAALAAGAQVLDTAWQSLVHCAALQSEGVAPPALAPWVQQREQLALQSAPVQQQFNAAVAHYNAAVAQFPASLLAWLFDFKKAQTL
ncbi:LemA family protein [Pulveribacter suum]|uniref:LemA family protein n=1 Tax=Pulveribacter suum TaxID=2116657 RepID=A0A2P1NI92_9BURK|nr:LemA family protein [Pulveribacter suum]AVP56788.1 LemA family protein [Pulveribacter suum]